MTLVGLGALAVTLTAAFLLVRHRKESGSLTKAAFLSARNDALANIGVIAAGLLATAHPSIRPDIVVGMIIAVKPEFSKIPYRSPRGLRHDFRAEIGALQQCHARL